MMKYHVFDKARNQKYMLKSIEEVTYQIGMKEEAVMSIIKQGNNRYEITIK